MKKKENMNEENENLKVLNYQSSRNICIKLYN